MKFRRTIILFTVFLLILTGCGGNNALRNPGNTKQPASGFPASVLTGKLMSSIPAEKPLYIAVVSGNYAEDREAVSRILQERHPALSCTFLDSLESANNPVTFFVKQKIRVGGSKNILYIERQGIITDVHKRKQVRGFAAVFNAKKTVITFNEDFNSRKYDPLAGFCGGLLLGFVGLLTIFAAH